MTALAIVLAIIGLAAATDRKGRQNADTDIFIGVVFLLAVGFAIAEATR